MTESNEITNNMTLEQRARDLLAAEYERAGLLDSAAIVRQTANNTALEDLVLGAIKAALQQAQQPDHALLQCAHDQLVTRLAACEKALADRGAKLMEQQPDLSEAGLAALRSITPGEMLTREQWDGVCEYVREQEAVLDGYKAEVELRTETQQPGAQAVRDAVDKALQRAWSLANTYADQANSHSYSQNRKSVQTLETFRTLHAETLALIASQQESRSGSEGERT